MSTPYPQHYDLTGHITHVNELRAFLAGHLASAHQELDAALAVVDQLTSQGVYDADYAEGDRYFVEFVRDARKALVAARHLNPDNH